MRTSSQILWILIKSFKIMKKSLEILIFFLKDFSPPWWPRSARCMERKLRYAVRHAKLWFTRPNTCATEKGQTKSKQGTKGYKRHKSQRHTWHMWHTSNLIESRISKATQSRPFFLLTLVTFILSIHRHSHFHTFTLHKLHGLHSLV